jgi:phosphohistidine phosphatase
MHVYLLRHGIAEDRAPDGGDSGRRLTSEGKDRLALAAPSWRRALRRPEAIVSSPLTRAQQTAAILAEAVGFAGAIELRDLLEPGARPMLALELLQAEMRSGRDAVALVGHEPHLGSLLGLLLTGSERSAVPLKKGMLVGVELDSSANMLGRMLFALSQRVAGELS